MENQSELYRSGVNSKTIFDRAILYLTEKYEIRYNIISLDLEIRTKNSLAKWTVLNINSLLIELVQVGIDISMPKLEVLVRSHLMPQYNPIKEYFSNLSAWDGQDHIGILCSYLETNNNIDFKYHFEKWLTRTVLCAIKEGYINKQCLVFTSGQHTGKSTFFRFLIPKSLEMYYTENISIDKDGIISICKNLICNLDELAVQSKSDINVLKSFISKSNANVRLPYSRKSEYLNRICSFVGSTNQTDFLTDETGSVRWLVFEIININFRYSKEVEIDKVWAQAFYNAFERKNYNPELTPIDIEENERRNDRYKQVSTEEEIILSHFEKSHSENEFMTASEIMLAMNNALGIRLHNVRIGKALTKLKFERIKHSKKQVYGYLIRRKL